MRESKSSGSTIKLIPYISLSQPKSIARCRQEQTSVHAAICAAFLLAVRQQNHSKQTQNLNCTSPINLRPYLTSANQENLSLYIGAERTSHLLNFDADFWEVARSAKQQLKQSMTSNKLFGKIFQLQQWLSTFKSPDDALQVFKDRLDYDITVSNLMRLTIAQQFGELELQAIYGPVMNGTKLRYSPYPDGFPAWRLGTHSRRLRLLFLDQRQSLSESVPSLEALNEATQAFRLFLVPFGPVMTTGVKNDRLVGVASLGDRLFFTLVCSERVMLQSQTKTLHKEAIHLLNEAIASNYQEQREIICKSNDLLKKV